MLIRCVRKIIITWISRPSVWSIIAYAVSIRWCSDILSHLILFKTFTLTLLVFIDTVILISSTSRYLTQMEYIAQVGEPIKGSVRILNIRLCEKKLCSSSWVRPRSYPRKKINIFVLVYSFVANGAQKSRPWSVLLKAGPITSAPLGNQIQRFKIQDRCDGSPHHAVWSTCPI